MPGILNERDPLPDVPLHGMLSSKGSKVRLTFKLTSDEVLLFEQTGADAEIIYGWCHAVFFVLLQNSYFVRENV